MMLKSAELIFCQRCLAANHFGQDICSQCGTRLMLVVEPPTLRYEDECAMVLDHEENLVERVSVLENRLTRITEKIEHLLDRNIICRIGQPLARQ